MKQKKTRISLLLLSIVMLITIAIGSRAFQPASEAYMTDTLKKASLAFAGARAINALVSVAQKIETGGSVKLLGTGGSASLAPFEWLDPLNDLVERFSLVMLACCVAMGILLFLNQALSWLSLAILLPVSVLLLLFSIGIRTSKMATGRQAFRAGCKLLAITAIAAIMVPMMAAVNFLAYSFFLENTYTNASISVDDTRKTLSEINTDDGLLDKIEKLQQQASALKTRAERIISHILDLITVFLIQTILLPLAVFWLFIKLIVYIAGSDMLLPTESFFARPYENTMDS